MQKFFLLFLFSVLISTPVFPQNQYRIPDWNQGNYSWKKSHFAFMAFGNPLIKTEKNMALNYLDSTARITLKKYYAMDMSPIFGLRPSIEEDYNSVFKIYDNQLNIYQGDSVIQSYRIKRKKLISIENQKEKKLKYKYPSRIALALHVGATGLPYLITYEKFFVRDKAYYAGLNGHVIPFTAGIGAHLGFQHQYLMTQLGLNYTYLFMDSEVISINPKVGFIFNGLYCKLGPSFILNDAESFSLLSNDDFLSFSFELGYYWKINKRVFSTFK